MTYTSLQVSSTHRQILIIFRWQINSRILRMHITMTSQWARRRLKSPASRLLNRLFNVQIKETSKLRVTGLCVGNSPVTGEFPVQRASSAENMSIWWRHHDLTRLQWLKQWGILTHCHSEPGHLGSSNSLALFVSQVLSATMLLYFVPWSLYEQNSMEF